MAGDEADIQEHKRTLHQAIDRAESEALWASVADYCRQYLEIEPNDTALAEKQQWAERRAQAARHEHKAREAVKARRWRQAERELAAYTALVPDDEHAQRQHEKVEREIQRWVESVRKQTLTMIQKARPDRVVEAFDRVPDWLRDEPEVARMLEASQDLREAADDLRAGRFARAGKALTKWEGLEGCEWVATWRARARKGLRRARGRFRLGMFIAAILVALTATSLLVFAFTNNNELAFIVALGAYAGAGALLIFGWVLACAIRGSKRCAPHETFVDANAEAQEP